VAYENLAVFQKKNDFNGEPVRQDLIDIESKRVAAIEYFNLDATKKTLLFLAEVLEQEE
jgi:UDP-N-acetylglucosamine--N-acetylmuramyl-(pentapeptide) pyrophosphoryl-undecaprenol N-acetylglucosamine transferase